VPEPQLNKMLETGAGLVIATVGADGEPRAARAWSWSLVAPTTDRLRVAVCADDPITVADLTNGTVAVTAADVATFESLQVKGRVVAVEAPDAVDLERVRRHSEVFFGRVHAIDGNPVELLLRMLPNDIVMIELVVEQAYDQTPGPDAGTRVRGVGP
jgi:hypothetical protein